MAGMDRRQFLYRAGVTAGALAAPGAVWARAFAQDAEPVRVYLLVVDGLRPDEVGLMPALTSLAQSGTYWPDARAEMIAETTPNHVAMLTGMHADRHGMPGNGVPGRLGFNPRVGDNPRYLKADTLFTLLRRQAPDLVSASVTSKQYLVGMSRHDRDGDGEPDATYVYGTRAQIPVSDHETDYLVMQEAVRVSRELDPDFLFVSLGDVDRVGHTDPSGNLPLGVWRTQTLTDTDTLIRGFVEDLRSRGVWDSTVMVVAADHNMDWSQPHRIVNLTGVFDADELLAGETVVGQNGGAALYALRSPAHPGAAAMLLRMRKLALEHEGVEEALFTGPRAPAGGEEHWVGRVHPEWGLTGDLTGDLIATVKPGWRVTERSQTSNPVPGNHGHPVTLPIPVVVSGGFAGVVTQQVDPHGTPGPSEYQPHIARNIDLAPTIAWLLGLQPPPGGFDGRVLEEAFDSRPPPRTVRSTAIPMPHVERHAGPGRIQTAVAVSTVAYADGAETVVLARADGFADALAGTPLAIAHGAPLLLTPTEALHADAAEEIERLGAGRAYVLGGEAALAASVEEDLADMGLEVIRLSGDNRYATAAAIAAEVGALNGEAVLVAGERRGAPAFADALAAGPIAGSAGRPILLTRPTALPEETLEALEELEVARLTIGGGTAVVSHAVEDDLRERGIVVERLAGADRYETAVLFAERGIREGALTDELWLVSGADFPDALAAGAAVGWLPPPPDSTPSFQATPYDAAPSTLLLVPPEGLTGAAAAFVARRADELVRLRFVGGAAALPESLEAEVLELVRARRAR